MGCNDMHCTCIHGRCYAIALAHMFHATQMHLRTCSMLRQCTCTHVRCYANALAHMFDATQMHLHTCSMLRQCTILFTDGAPCYPSVAQSLNIQHEWVNHSKGQFTKTVARAAPGNPKVVAHTGTIDSCWNLLKRFLPRALHSRHAMLFTYCKAWQWRFVHRNQNVADITAQTVRKLT